MMIASSGEGQFRRLVPVGGYLLAQPFFLFTVLQAFLERGVSLWWPFPDPMMFLYVFVPAALPALLTGTVDGFARSLRRARWWMAPIRIVAFLLIVALGLGIALIGAFFLAFTESNLNADIGSLPLGTYLGALVGMEAILAVSWGVALLTRHFLEDRPTRVESR